MGKGSGPKVLGRLHSFLPTDNPCHLKKHVEVLNRIEYD